MTAEIGLTSQNYPSGSGTPALGAVPKEYAAPPNETTPPQRDAAELSAEAARRQAEASAPQANPETKRISSSILNGIQDSLDSVEQNVRAVRDLSLSAAQTGLRPAQAPQRSEVQAQTTPANDSAAGNTAMQTDNAQSLNEAGQRLREIDNAGQQITQQVRQLQAMPSPLAGQLEVSVDTSNLGRLQTGPGQYISLADVAAAGLNGIFGNVDLTDEVAGRALTQISVMRNEVENYQSGLLASSGNVAASEDLLGPAGAQKLLQRVRENFSNFTPNALYQAAAAGISGERAVDLLT